MFTDKKPPISTAAKVRADLNTLLDSDSKAVKPLRRSFMFSGSNPYAVLSIACFVGLFLLLIGGA